MITTDIEILYAKTLIILFSFDYGEDDQRMEISEKSQIIVVYGPFVYLNHCIYFSICA